MRTSMLLCVAALLLGACQPAAAPTPSVPDHPPALRFTLDPGGLNMDLRLRRNDALFSPDLRAAQWQADGTLKLASAGLERCHYLTEPGESWAALSTCQGADRPEGAVSIRGVMHALVPLGDGRVSLAPPEGPARTVALVAAASPRAARVEVAVTGGAGGAAVAQGLTQAKVLEVFLFNDHAQVGALGQGAVTRALAAANVAAGTLANLQAGTFTVQLSVAGVVGFGAGNPFAVVEPYVMDTVLSAFTAWASGRRAALQAAFARAMDVPFLLSALPMVRVDGLGNVSTSSVGLAAVAAVCTPAAANGLALDRGSLAQLGNVMAHELGHALGANHDASGSPTVMAPSVASPPNTVWSGTSSSSIQQRLAQLGESTCLDNPSTPFTGGAVCGNGVLDDGEECDALSPDACCTSACRLAPDAECSPSQGACCTQACTIVRDTATVCKAGDGVCQPAATCNGVTPVCYAATTPVGTACTTDRLGLSGTCFQGACVSRTEECRTINNGQFPNAVGCATSTACAQLQCGDANNACSVFWSVTAPDGVPCAPSGTAFCVRGTCTAGAALNQDDCPSDPAKTQPGLCGCDRADTDSDADAVPDCVDRCPTVAGRFMPPCEVDAGAPLASSSSSGAGGASSQGPGASSLPAPSSTVTGASSLAASSASVPSSAAATSAGATSGTGAASSSWSSGAGSSAFPPSSAGSSGPPAATSVGGSSAAASMVRSSSASVSSGSSGVSGASSARASSASRVASSAAGSVDTSAGASSTEGPQGGGGDAQDDAGAPACRCAAPAEGMSGWGAMVLALAVVGRRRRPRSAGGVQARG